MITSIRCLALLVLVVATLNRVAGAQQLHSFLSEPELRQWDSQEPLEQIPWKLRLGSGLTIYQRIVSYCAIEVEGRYFKRRPVPGDLIATIRVNDSNGHSYEDHAAQFLDSKIPALKQHGVIFTWRAFILPGEYQVMLGLYDKSTGRHNFAVRNLHIEPLNKDPLPAAWSNLPAMEFLKIDSELPDLYFHPESLSRLRLPVVAHHPVRVEILANLTGTGRAMVSHRAYNFNLTSLLPILKTFSQIDISGGTLNLEILDLVRRQVPFQQEEVHDLDWPRLKNAVIAGDPTKVDVRALQDIQHTAAFFRQEVANRLAAGSGPPDALPVIILISSSAFFDRLDDIRDTLLPSQCQCVVHYIRYNPSVLRSRVAMADFDNVKKVLKPLPVQTHVAQSPQDLRRIMAGIMDEIARM